MMCCACNGVCCHVGPHSYCWRHGGGYFPSQPVITQPTTNPIQITYIPTHCPGCRCGEQDLDSRDPSEGLQTKSRLFKFPKRKNRASSAEKAETR